MKLITVCRWVSSEARDTRSRGSPFCWFEDGAAKKTKIFAPIVLLMSNECKGFQICDLYSVSTGDGLFIDEIKLIYGKK